VEGIHGHLLEIEAVNGIDRNVAMEVDCGCDWDRGKNEVVVVRTCNVVEAVHTVHGRNEVVEAVHGTTLVVEEDPYSSGNWVIA